MVGAAEKVCRTEGEIFHECGARFGTIALPQFSSRCITVRKQLIKEQREAERSVDASQIIRGGLKLFDRCSSGRRSVADP